jgi:ribosomal protein S18 acetylase RimI-like enzyme
MDSGWVVRVIEAKEIELFASILAEAAEWLREQGQEMWTPKQISVENLLGNHTISEMHIGYLNGGAAAAMILQEDDPLFWPEAAGLSDSLYLHKLCVRRSFAKAGCSTEMIRWAMEQVGARGKTYLRLDCAADRPKLCAFYERHGFVKVRERLQQKYPTAFYEWKAVH